MRGMIQALDPRIAAVTTEAGGPATPIGIRNSHRFLPYYATLGRRAVNKLSQRALARPLLPARRTAHPARALARAAFVSSFDDGRPLRHASMRSAPLFERAAIDALLARAGAASDSEAALLGRVLTLELSLRATDSAIEDGACGFARDEAAATPA